jgi:hypothetical protein
MDGEHFAEAGATRPAAGSTAEVARASRAATEDAGAINATRGNKVTEQPSKVPKKETNTPSNDCKGDPENFSMLNENVERGKDLKLPEKTWDKKENTPFKRRDIIDRANGNGPNDPDATGHNYPGIDRFNEESGTATSTKSLDTGAKTYQSGSKLKSTLKRYINQVADFNGSDTATQSGTRVDSSMIKNRTLELVIPERGLTGEQANAINDAANYAQSTDASSQPSNPVQLIIKIGKDSPGT